MTKPKGWLTDSEKSAGVTSAYLQIDDYLRGYRDSNDGIDGSVFYRTEGVDLPSELKKKDLYEFSLIADRGDNENDNTRLEPVIFWVFRRNGHIITHYLSLRTGRNDSFAFRSWTVMQNPKVLCGYCYRIKLDKKGLIFRTQPILLPEDFAWSDIIGKVRKLIAPAVSPDGYLLLDYEKFRNIFLLSSDRWWELVKDLAVINEQHNVSE